MRIPADLREARWSGRNPGGFRPEGKIYASKNKGELAGVEWKSDDTLAARLFVGFSVGSKPTYELDDLIAIVREVRERQVPADPSATFLAQRGLYRYKQTGEVVEESGGQVIIIGQDVTRDEMEAQMVELAEIIARRMKQELVIVELQENGLVKRTIGVNPS